MESLRQKKKTFVGSLNLRRFRNSKELNHFVKLNSLTRADYKHAPCSFCFSVRQKLKLSRGFRQIMQ